MDGEGSGRQRGRVALVTGGAAGIGQAFGERLATAGAEIVIADIADASETQALVEAAGGAALAIRADASSADDVRNLAQETFERFGKVDVLVHNAGTSPFQDFLDLTFQDWRRGSRVAGRRGRPRGLRSSVSQARPVRRRLDSRR
jgi:NAD(P)-dependent dehydrogenase (short-subunit alcohol dehydrogenase family)